MEGTSVCRGEATNGQTCTSENQHHCQIKFELMHKKDALVEFDVFVKTWGVEKAIECLTKDGDALLTFYDFPAEHWKHLRTTNVIESSFATVCHRTVRSKLRDVFSTRP